MTFDQWLKLFTSPLPLLRKGSLNFGDVRNDAQQKLEAQSPLARSNQVKGNYLLLAVNYEAKLLLCSMWCITTIHFLAMYLVSLMLLFTAALLFSNNHAYSLSGEVETQIAFNLSIVDEQNIQESYMGIEENITINMFAIHKLELKIH
ncbi:hypothetical protein T01_7615 [Trichinella spiralis]|uniref:Uncharacterized protein n=1 Tax=Trichinella spiralis TaxID=6334 RepID=A0A0V1AV97_TRISP|nr:hypothetical protein T01_14553 [Trichinella spiralis]KRY28131.1 hypothetical protein T01_7615 [Trichinella spiralis]